MRTLTFLLLVACQPRERITIDGSSTLAPLAELLTESYARARPDHEVVVRTSGSAAGLARLCRGEVDIAASARAMNEDEARGCKIKTRAIAIATDAIVMAAHQNAPVRNPVLTLAQLRRLWEPGSPVRTWRDLRPDWPATPLRLYGAGEFSGTYETFTRVIVGKERESRSDVVTSEDDGVLVYGIANDTAAIGYLGLSAYRRSKSKLQIVAIDFGDGPVLPTAGTPYAPLNRTLYLYVDDARAQEEPLQSVLEHFITNAPAARALLGYP
jgi:phosphate transport system substrate-binding protein